MVWVTLGTGVLWPIGGQERVKRIEPPAASREKLTSDCSNRAPASSLATEHPRSHSASGSHAGQSVLDWLPGNAAYGESLAELLEGAVLAPLRLPLGQVLAAAIRIVGIDGCLVAADTEWRGDLVEILDDVIGQTKRDQGHRCVSLHALLVAFTLFDSVTVPPSPPKVREDDRAGRPFPDGLVLP